jgi:hypothetical protein
VASRTIIGEGLASGIDLRRCEGAGSLTQGGRPERHSAERGADYRGGAQKQKVFLTHHSSL